MIRSSALFRIVAGTAFILLIGVASWRTTLAWSLFLPRLSFDAGGGATEDVAAADVNGDGKADLILAIQNAPTGAPPTNGLVGVLLGNGDGTYAAATTYDSAGGKPFSLAVGNLDGDRHVDIVVLNSCQLPGDACAPGTLGILRGRGDGTFDPAVVVSQIGSVTSPVQLADVNGDGAVDILLGVGTNAGPSVEMLFGNGDATFRVPLLVSAGASEVRSVAVGDVNGDGRADLIVTGEAQVSAGQFIGTAGVLLGNADGSFRPVVSYNTGSAGEANAAAIADFNLDGRVDVAVANYPDDRIGVLIGNGDGTLQPVVLFGSGAPLAWDLVAADVNGDGKPDLAVGNGSGVIGILVGRGDGTFQTVETYPVPGINTSIAAADLNGDGAVDLVASEGTHSVSVLLNSAPCSEAPPAITLSVDPASLWPPSGKPVNVTVSGTIAASGCTLGAPTATYTVGDEYGELTPSGPIAVGDDGRFSFAVRLPASRRGDDADGRHYTIAVDVRSAGGAVTTATTMVIVPHDRGR